MKRFLVEHKDWDIPPIRVILYHQHGGMPEYKVNGETVYIMSQNEILSIIED